ncbi:MAG: serine hydrolase [Nitrospirae bacterium]|nr:serine hydrolase [Nitrospirota bacterium]
MASSVNVRLNYRQAIIYLVVAALMFGAGWASHIINQRYYSHKHRWVALKGFRYTNPLLDVELPEGVDISNEPIPFKYKIESFVRDQIRRRQATDIAVYYRDLHDGPWFGINEDMQFNPASMMKVPVMIAILKRAERDPYLLRRTLAYDGKSDMSTTQNFRPRHTITPHRPYTIEELLRYMISYSDNNATAVLYNDLNPRELSAVLDGMDIDNRPNDDENSVSVHGYSGFFRILFNASFLNREMSEKALQLLTMEDFSQGLSAGVPQGTEIAAKYGENVQGMKGEIKQLHEFGIVYHPKHPYIIGIMTRGNDFGIQTGIIREISRMIYAEVDAGAVK